MILQTTWYTLHILSNYLENYNLEELDQLTVLACKSSQQSVLSLVSLECFFSMCLKVWHLLVLWLSEENVHWNSLYKLLSRTGLPWISSCCTGLPVSHREALLRSALVNLRWSLAQLSDLVEWCRLARSAPIGRLVPEPWLLIQIWRPKWGFHRGQS